MFNTPMMAVISEMHSLSCPPSVLAATSFLLLKKTDHNARGSDIIIETI